MRRIKSVSVSIPAVVGTYASVNCTFSLLNSSIRKSSVLKDSEYLRQGSEDDRFIDYTGAIQSMVTGNGQNDGGLFETNLRDDRFLPFEGAGAVGKSQLALPRTPCSSKKALRSHSSPLKLNRMKTRIEARAQTLRLR
jgi:hypothetical protein